MIQLHFINTKHKPQVYITIKYLIVGLMDKIVGNKLYSP